MRIEFTVNGTPRAVEADPLRRLLDILREDLDLTGTKEGCGEGECGACAVLIDGELANACLVPALQLPGRAVVTIEGLGTEAEPDRVQQAFLAEGAVQCGFCIPGMVIASHALLRRHPQPSREEIRHGLAGNLCRCTGYERIIRAVERAARMEEGRRDAGASAGASTAASTAAAHRPGARTTAAAEMEPHHEVDATAAASLTRDCAGVDPVGADPSIGGDPLAPRLRVPELLAGDVTPVAGGTDLLTALQMGADPPARVLDLSAIPGLRQIALLGSTDPDEPAWLEVGATVTVTQLLEDPRIARHAPALHQAAVLFGAPAIRNRATIGGNLMSASPAADLPPALLALDAVAVFAGARGERSVPLEQFYLGYRRTARQAGEILARIRIPIPGSDAGSTPARSSTSPAEALLPSRQPLPPPPLAPPSPPAPRPPHRHSQAFYKVGTRRAQSIAKVSLAGRLELDDDGTIRLARLAAGSIAATPILLWETAAWLEGQRLPHRGSMPGTDERDEQPLFSEAGRRAAAEVTPIDDVRSTAAYRRSVLGTLVRRFLEDQAAAGHDG